MLLEACGIRIEVINPGEIARMKSLGYKEVILPVEKLAETPIEKPTEKPELKKAGK